MSINITGVHFSITDAIHDNAVSRINRLAKRYPLINANVTFSQEHDDFTCKVDYKGDNQEAQAQATEKDLYKAIAIATDRVERQLNDQKENAKRKGLETIRTKTEKPEADSEDELDPVD